jgi:tRNA nucleotidyltransferase (CCA-adding enzyme)
MDERFDGRAVLARVRELPGGRELIDLAQGRSDVALVGGAVRDLLAATGTDRGDARCARIPESAKAKGACHPTSVGGERLPASVDRAPRELDVVVGDAPEDAGDEGPSLGDGARLFAGELASRLDAQAETNEHERFGTALVEWDGGRIDVATRRAESYPEPGALPDVRAGTVEEDLGRRDFTVNAIAVSLGGARRGELQHVPAALDDLAAGRLRVLHEQSFIDDPTRLLRLARYAARLGFEVEPHTAALAAQAVSQGALSTVSGARIGAELRLALAESDAVAALAAMEELGLFKALHPRLRFDERLARAALDELSGGEEDRRSESPPVEPALAGRLLLAALLQPMLYGLEDGAENAAIGLLTALEFPAADRNLVLMAAICADAVADELACAEEPSEVYEAASHVSLEGVALASAWAEQEWRWSGAPAAARRWLRELRHVRLLITGDDLVAAGIPEGPEIGWRLKATLCMRLDGELGDGREAELAAALEANT